MLTFYNDRHSLHHGVELDNGVLKPCVEMPSRAKTILARIKQINLGDVRAPLGFDRSYYTAIHSESYVTFLENAWAEWRTAGFEHPALPLVWPVRDLRGDVEPTDIVGKLGFYAMDAGASITSGTWQAVCGSANSALSGMQEIITTGAPAVFALCRPPGHHAARAYMGGYCYLNNAAIAAQYALAHGANRVAILDVDYHHGNGTQSIFYDRADLLSVSVHADPLRAYPYFSGYVDERGKGQGEGFNHNYVLPDGANWEKYQQTLKDACAKITAFKPDVVVIALGVDTYKGDPISSFRLENEDYLRMGAMLRTLGKPILFVMEGGYMVDDIGVNAVNVLLGFEEGGNPSAS